MKYFVLTENMNDEDFEMLKNLFHPIQLLYLHNKIVHVSLSTTI